MYESASVISYLSGGKEDIQACTSALKLGLETSIGEASQRRLDLLQINDITMFFQHSSSSFQAVVEDVLLGVASPPFSSPQMIFIQIEQLGFCFLDFSP